MAIPGSRTSKSGDGRGYPRPRPNNGDSSYRPRTGGDSGGYRPNGGDSYRPRPSGGDTGAYRPRQESVEVNRNTVQPQTVAPKPAEVAVTPTPAVTTASQFVLTDDLRELIKLVAETDLSEVMVESSDWRVRVRREKQQSVVEYAPVQVPTASQNASRSTHSNASQPVSSTTNEDTFHKVTSPMVGIFYRSPDPKARPFVQEGEMVEKGQTIGIIEAMKIMNEIVSEHTGRCVRLSAENGQPVEYGQTLLLLEPA